MEDERCPSGSRSAVAWARRNCVHGLGASVVQTYSRYLQMSAELLNGVLRHTDTQDVSK